MTPLLSRHAELRPAAIPHPDLVAVVAPCAAEDAIDAAQLPRQVHAAARVDAAAVRVSVIRFANHQLGSVAVGMAVAAASTAEGEFGAASVIDPDAVVVEAPSASFDAVGAADLPRDAHAERGVGGAEAAAAVGF